MWILCLDADCYKALSGMHLQNVTLIPLDDLENCDEELFRSKSNRSIVEYYFTCTPALPLYVLDKNLDIDHITYLDADLFFFSDPSPIFREMADNSIAIMPHRFSPANKHKGAVGLYNVGWLTFRRSPAGLTGLHWWRERCIEWCYDRVEEGRYADQKYLDEFPRLFQEVAIITHKGANLAPWNLSNYIIRLVENRVWVDDQPLIFYHYHGLKRLSRWVWNPQLERYGVQPQSEIRKHIYHPYIADLLKLRNELWIKASTNGDSVGKTWLYEFMGALKSQLSICRNITEGRYYFHWSSKSDVRLSGLLR
jgi:hypothetical protein